MANYWAVDLRVTGVTEKLDQLRKFDEKTYRVVIDELEQAASKIVNDTRKAMPDDNALSNWGGWMSADSRRVRNGIVTIHQRSKLRPIPFEAGKARADVRPKVTGKYRKGTRLSTVVNVQSMNAGGAIWELVGSTNVNWGTTQGKTFRDNLAGKYRTSVWPRGLGPAWRDNKDAAIERIDEIVSKYVGEASSD
jgi:hypothetical protein